MEFTGVLIASGLILTAVMISKHTKIGLEKDLILCSVRAFIQLLAVGYLIKIIFDIEKTVYVLLMILAMILIATYHSSKRGKGVPGAFWIIFFAISFGSLFTLGSLVLFGAIGSEPRYLIPIAGMIIGNSMNASSLTTNRLLSEIRAKRLEIESSLSLGATSRQAIDLSLKETLKAAMIPTIDSMKVVGIVHLPGMMSGIIIAGASPLLAVKYQLIVIYMLTSAVSITSIIVGLLAYRQFFTPSHQLLFPYNAG
jgi:putative ABC transport system permease protein